MGKITMIAEGTWDLRGEDFDPGVLQFPACSGPEIEAQRTIDYHRGIWCIWMRAPEGVQHLLPHLVMAWSDAWTDLSADPAF